MPTSRLNRYIHQFAIGLAFIVVGLGAYTRLKHAGLGCPDWPKCFENWIVHANITQPALSPLASEKAWIEMIHRYAAGILSITILVLRLLASHNKQQTTRLTIICLAIIIQALFGMWTVTWRLHPLAVMPHLLGGMTITTLLCLDYQHKHLAHIENHINPAIRQSLQLLWLCLILQFIVGGWTSANYAALVCPDFPQCQGQWFAASFKDFVQGFSWPLGYTSYEGGVLSGEGRIAIHITHRIGACICSIIIGRLLWLVHKENTALPQAWIQRYHLLCSLFGLQVVLGILNVIWQLPITIAVGHNLVALLIMITTSSMLTRQHRTHIVTEPTTEHCLYTPI